MTKQIIKQEFEEKWHQHFRGSDMQYASDVVWKWVDQAITQAVEEAKKEQIDKLIKSMQAWEPMGESDKEAMEIVINILKAEDELNK